MLFPLEGIQILTGWQAQLPNDRAVDVSNGMPALAWALGKCGGYNGRQARCRPGPHGAYSLDSREERFGDSKIVSGDRASQIFICI